MKKIYVNLFNQHVNFKVWGFFVASRIVSQEKKQQTKKNKKREKLCQILLGGRGGERQTDNSRIQQNPEWEGKALLVPWCSPSYTEKNSKIWLPPPVDRSGIGPPNSTTPDCNMCALMPMVLLAKQSPICRWRYCGLLPFHDVYSLYPPLMAFPMPQTEKASFSSKHSFQGFTARVCNTRWLKEFISDQRSR